MKFSVGQKVRIKSLDWYNENTNECGYIMCGCVPFNTNMSIYCGKVLTIDDANEEFSYYKMKECEYVFTDEMIEGLVEEECPQDFIEKYCKSCGTQRCDRTKEYLDGCPYYNIYMHGKQKNDMKRNACQKCVFAVYDDNPHCGLRGFRTSFNVERCSAENDTIPNGYELQEDGYFSWIEKKKEYPKTYEECLKIIGIKLSDCYIQGYKSPLLEDLQELIICRDAYWKIAGEEMGLRKPWEPSKDKMVYSIYRHSNEIETDFFSGESVTFEFPTKEMRDAFYENFKELIESVKELL